MGSFPYPCCGELRFNSELGCDSLWILKDKPFAYVMGTKTDCISPCARIEGTEMILEECVDMNLTLVCKNGMNFIVEKRAFYYSQQCARPSTVPHSTAYNMAPDLQGSMWLFLLAMVYTFH